MNPEFSSFHKDFHKKISSILSSLKVLLEKNDINHEDSILIARAYQNTQQLLQLAIKIFKQDDSKENFQSVIDLLEGEMNEFMYDLDIEDDIKQQVLTTQNIKTQDIPNIEFISFHEMTDSDMNWILMIEQQVEKEISNFNFNAERLANQVFLSRRQLDRRLKLLSNFTTGQFIREIRLRKAKELLTSNNQYSIKEVAFKVGIKSTSHFAKLYKERFNTPPSEER